MHTLGCWWSAVRSRAAGYAFGMREILGLTVSCGNYIYGTLPDSTYIYSTLSDITYIYGTLPDSTYIYSTLSDSKYIYNTLDATECFYCIYNLLNMFPALICPSSGARDYTCVIAVYGV